jgi:hypothetical protein
MIHTLDQFVTQWADDTLELPVNQDSNLTPAKQEYRLRPSRLGCAAYITAFEYLLWLWGYPTVAEDNQYYGRRQDIFTTGHEVEARLVNVMRQCGLMFETQVPVTFTLAKQVIEGTSDMVINDTVVDIKTASASNYKRLISGYNDLTYRTQLALYAYGLGLDDVGLLLYNKDTSELHYKPIRLTNEIDRVHYILELLTEMKGISSLAECIDFIIENFEITLPPCQMRNKESTGRYLVPPDLMYNPVVRDLLHKTEVIAGTRYVTYSYSKQEVLAHLIKSCA